MFIPEKKVNVLSDIQVICENKGSRFGYFAWSTVTRLPDGRLALYSSGFRIKHVCPFGKGAVCYSYDDGESWSAPSVAIDTPLDDRDFGVAVSDNRVIVTFYNHSTSYQRDVNRDENTGELFQFINNHLDSINEKEVEEQYLGSFYVISEDSGNHFGDLKRVSVHCPHGPAVLPNGRFLYVGHAYSFIEPSRVAFRDQEPSQLQCWMENEQGEFEFVSALADVPEEIGRNSEPHTIALPDGTILTHIRVERFVPGKGGAGWEEFTLYQSESYDGGKTFTDPHPILPSMGGAPAHILRHSSGTLLSTYSIRDYVDESLNGAIGILISRDNGKNWESRFITRTTHSWDHGYPSTVEREDGTLLTAYYDHEKDDNAIIKQIIWSLDDESL